MPDSFSKDLLLFDDSDIDLEEIMEMIRTLPKYSAEDYLADLEPLASEVFKSHYSLVPDNSASDDVFRLEQIYIMKMMFMALKACHSTESTLLVNDNALSKVEENALRYMNGYIPYQLKKKIVRKSKSCDSYYLECIKAMRDCKDAKKWDSVGESRNWIESLFKVNDISFLFFKEWNLFFTNNPCYAREMSRWLVLIMIVKLYVQVRMFSYAKEQVEKHKKITKSYIKGSKGLRKTLAEK
ncbi:uncharacterized protein LOC144358487 [Saccoglossus kowalevskii]